LDKYFKGNILAGNKDHDSIRSKANDYLSQMRGFNG
jgi:hypothetical protein